MTALVGQFIMGTSFRSFYGELFSTRRISGIPRGRQDIREDMSQAGPSCCVPEGRLL
jgi:hypothetical protein